MVSLRLGGILSKLEQNAQFIGIAVGLGTYGYDKLLQDVSLALSGQIHLPNMKDTIVTFFQAKNLSIATTALGLYIGGELLGRKSLKEGAKGLIIGNAIQHVLWNATHSTVEEFAQRDAGISRGGGNSAGYSY